MLRKHMFSIYVQYLYSHTIRTPRALAVLALIGLLIVKTLTNALLTISKYYYDLDLDHCSEQ